MFRRLLIANRGEVAARVAATCRRMGIATVAVASSADRDQAWLADVDHVVGLGGAKPAASYLDAAALLEAARHTGCTAVHPGWGFLSENAAFAARCEAAGLTFVGPSPEHMRRMGDKAVARATMASLGMPIIPGSKEPVDTLERARQVAEEVGYPVLLKAVSGGGGRGMRGVDHPDELAEVIGDVSEAERVIEVANDAASGKLQLEVRYPSDEELAAEQTALLAQRRDTIIMEQKNTALVAAQRAGLE